jgi:rod shape-determining protein MreD
VSSSFRSKYRSIEIVTGPALWPTIGWTMLGVFVQMLCAQWLTVRGAVPAFAMIAVVLYSVRVGARRGLPVGVIAGALEDVFAGTGGAWTIATTLVTLGCGVTGRGFFSDGFPMLGALVAIAVLVRDLIFWFVMRLEGYPPGLFIAHSHAALWQALITGCVTVVYLVSRSRFVADRTNVERYP